MVRIALLIAAFMCALTLGVSEASAGADPGFGHYFQWFRDDDGDGIPNGLDDDWIRPKDGDGYKLALRHRKTDGVAAVTEKDGNVLRKQYRFRFDPAGSGARQQYHKRLWDSDRD